eukprot:scaffold28021_cov19-Tisochrysis_lutea.AAC.2
MTCGCFAGGRLRYVLHNHDLSSFHAWIISRLHAPANPHIIMRQGAFISLQRKTVSIGLGYQPPEEVSSAILEALE